MTEDDHQSGIERLARVGKLMFDWSAATGRGPRRGESEREYDERIAAMHGDFLSTVRELFPHVNMTFDEEPELTGESLSTARIPVEIEGLDVDMGFRLQLERAPTEAEAKAIHRAVMKWYEAGSEGRDWGVIKDVQGPYPVDERTIEWSADLSAARSAAFGQLVRRLDAAIKPFDIPVMRLLLTTEPADIADEMDGGDDRIRTGE